MGGILNSGINFDRRAIERKIFQRPDRKPSGSAFFTQQIVSQQCGKRSKPLDRFGATSNTGSSGVCSGKHAGRQLDFVNRAVRWKPREVEIVAFRDRAFPFDRALDHDLSGAVRFIDGKANGGRAQGLADSRQRRRVFEHRRQHMMFHGHQTKHRKAPANKRGHYGQKNCFLSIFSLRRVEGEIRLRRVRHFLQIFVSIHSRPWLPSRRMPSGFG